MTLSLVSQDNKLLEPKHKNTLEWYEPHTIQASLDSGLCQALNELGNRFREYNSKRAICYARRLIARCANGDLPPKEGVYEFANLERLLRAFPVVTGGLTTVLPPPVLFGTAVPPQRQS